MLRQLLLTAERTVTRAGDIKEKFLTSEPRLENRPLRARGCLESRAAAAGSAVAIYPAFSDDTLSSGLGEIHPSKSHHIVELDGSMRKPG